MRDVSMLKITVLIAVISFSLITTGYGGYLMVQGGWSFALGVCVFFTGLLALGRATYLALSYVEQPPRGNRGGTAS